MNPVLETIKPVVKRSVKVKINEGNLKKTCSNFRRRDFKFWLEEAPFKIRALKDNEVLNFLFVFNSLVFCFWGEPKWKIEYQNGFYDGAFGLLAALQKALENNFPILNWNYLAKIPKEDLKEIFKGNVEIPLFKERLEILRENGEIILEKFNGDLENLLREGKGEALKLLEVITSNFPSFYDSAIYHGKEVLFHKRAQLLIADIYRKFEGKGIGKIKNINQLTAFADYKLPQILRKMGILDYSSDLAEKIDNKILIPQGSEEEIEIRANTIWAIELMKNELKSRFPNVTSIEIDSYLWLKGQEKSPPDKPYHLTKTIFY